MNTFCRLHWPLVLGMAALTLFHPVLNFTGLMQSFLPRGPSVVTALISLVWISIVVGFGLQQPLLTLVCTGFVSGLGVIIVGTLLALALTGTPGPFVNPIAAVAVLAINTLWGTLAGLAALVLQRALGTRSRGVEQ